jgi:hypothetical protein
MVRIVRSILAASVAGAFLLIAGCGEQAVSPLPAPTTLESSTGPVKTVTEEHAHKAGAHGGLIVAIGRDNYHAEAVFEKEGVLRLYTLGNDEAKVIDVEAQILTAFVRPEGGTEATSVLLKAEPQTGDGDGRTSQFVGKLPRELWGKRVEVTIPTIRIGGERFRLGFESASAHQETSMPPGIGDAEERKLFLTPAGRYTVADIKANGAITASEKFKGFQASHDLRPKPGEKICPVTLTKANPDCSWVIGGKTYEFCCPPCVEEFVRLARERPQEIQEPEEYTKK